MKNKIAIAITILISIMLFAGCGGKKEDTIIETSEQETESQGSSDVLLEVSRSDSWRDFMVSFDPYTDGGPAGSMEYDYRNEISQRRLMDCLFGQRCCVDYSVYPVSQPTDNGTTMKVPVESFAWAAEKIFHIETDTIASYKKTSPSLIDGNFQGEITKDENGIRWYESVVSAPKKAEFDGSYYYIMYERDHNDPTQNGTRYQGTYYAVMGLEIINGQEYWTMYTHSSNGFNELVEKEDITPEIKYENEVEMMIGNCDSVIMRDGPGKEYKRLNSYASGVPVTVMGETGDWYYLRYYDHVGWIFKEYVVPIS